MKQVNLSTETHQVLSQLCHVALKGAGVEALHLVNHIAAWLTKETEDKPQLPKAE